MDGTMGSDADEAIGKGREIDGERKRNRLLAELCKWQCLMENGYQERETKLKEKEALAKKGKETGGAVRMRPHRGDKRGTVSACEHCAVRQKRVAN